MKKTTVIISEVEYTNENGDSVHSDLDFDFDSKEQMRPVLHECLDEWLDKSNGEGGFYLRNTNHHFEDYDEGQPKRTPLPDGTLPLTEEEKKELKSIWIPNEYADIKYIKKIKKGSKHVLLMVFCVYGGNRGTIFGEDIIQDIKAILWLADRFNLEG